MKNDHVTANQAVLLLCIYRGFPQVQFHATSNAESRINSDAFGGTREVDLQVLMNKGWITKVGNAPRITEPGRKRVERMIGQTLANRNDTPGMIERHRMEKGRT